MFFWIGYIIGSLQAARCPSVQATELIELLGDCVLKRIRQSGVIQKAARNGASGDTRGPSAGGSPGELELRLGKRCEKIQVKANIEALLEGDTRSPSIGGGGEHASLEAVEGSIGGLGIATPVVSASSIRRQRRAGSGYISVSGSAPALTRRRPQ